MIPLRMVTAATIAKKRRHHSTEEKTADVRPPRDAADLLGPARARERQKSVEELHQKPYGEKQRGADLRHRPVNDEREQRDDARPRTEHQKGAEDACDAARCADRWDRRVRKDDRMHRAADRAASQIEQQIAAVSE